jgi:hypothetical protein
MNGQDAYAKPNIKYWLHELRLGRKSRTTQNMGGDPPSTRPRPKFYRFFGDLLFPRCEQFLTPSAFPRPRYVFTWSNGLGSKTTYSVDSLTC